MVNGKYFVIDSHCHIYPDKIAERAVEGTSNFYSQPFECKGTVEDLKKVGKEAGIDHYIVQSVATTPKQVKSINEFIARSVAESNGTMTGFGTLHPESSDIKGDFEYMLSLGLKGVKLHPDIQKFKIDDYRCLSIYELCEENNIPILMHTGDSRYDFSNPNRLLPVMKIYTGLTVIGAHFGGWSIWEEASRKLCDLENLYVDCSSSFPYIDKKTALEIIRRYGANKVLFGTDYPMWSPKSELNTLFSLGLDEGEIMCILNTNARKLLNME